MTLKRRIDEVIADLEDVKTTLEEVEAGVNGPSDIHQTKKDLQKATDKLEEINDGTESS